LRYSQEFRYSIQSAFDLVNGLSILYVLYRVVDTAQKGRETIRMKKILQENVNFDNRSLNAEKLQEFSFNEGFDYENNKTSMNVLDTNYSEQDDENDLGGKILTNVSINQLHKKSIFERAGPAKLSVRSAAAK
jgi:hypothetical protein